VILTRQRIEEEIERGDIIIDPFRRDQLNPNSYNYRLGCTIALKKCVNEAETAPEWHGVEIGAAGVVLDPGVLYLGTTEEILGSRRYVITLLGRSSLGRLGLFLNVTADLGHTGSASRWTLELKVVQRLRVYPGMRVGQVAFWSNCGNAEFYRGRYHRDLEWAGNRDSSLTTPEIVRT
jgi:dCTP deaminase